MAAIFWSTAVNKLTHVLSAAAAMSIVIVTTSVVAADIDGVCPLTGHRLQSSDLSTAGVAYNGADYGIVSAPQ
jgi:hypothetical protein